MWLWGSTFGNSVTPPRLITIRRIDLKFHSRQRRFLARAVLGLWHLGAAQLGSRCDRGPQSFPLGVVRVGDACPAPQRCFPRLSRAVCLIFHLSHPWECSHLSSCSSSLLGQEPHAPPGPSPHNFSIIFLPLPSALLPFHLPFLLPHGLPLIFKRSYSSPSFSGGNFNKCTNICYS